MDQLREFLMWSSLINYGILILWFCAFVFAHDPLQKLNDRVMGRKTEHFDTIHYAGIALYKMTVIFFNIIPWGVLELMHSR